MLFGVYTCVKNEQRLIVEWVAHYIGLGAQRIHVFDNGSSDKTVELLKILSLTFPRVTWEDWQPSGDWHSAAFDRGIEIMKNEGIEWAIACDADEFLCNQYNDSLDSLLRYFDDSTAIGVHWAIYGSSGLKVDPPGLYLESFLRRAHEDFSVHHHIKSIVRTHAVRKALTSHVFELETGSYRNVYREEIVWDPTPGRTGNLPTVEPWRFQHYFCRDRTSWQAKVKRSKEAPLFSDRNEADWIYHNRNEVLDETGLFYANKVRELLSQHGELSDISGSSR